MYVESQNKVEELKSKIGNLESKKVEAEEES